MNDLTEIGKSIKMELTRSTVVTPANYSFENALVAAALTLTETIDRNKRPALEVCSPESIRKAILAMAVQGLNPAKNQCYFVVYGQQLQCIRSYMGAQMTAMLVKPQITDIRAKVVYTGDQFDIDVVNGRDMIKTHKPASAFPSKADIIGAYAIAIGADEAEHLYVEIMGIEEIKMSWKQSKMTAVAESGAINQQSTHGKFTGEMCKRTVINRLCKRIINTSDDAAMLAAFEKTDELRPEEEIIMEEVEQHANKKLIDFDQRVQRTKDRHPDFSDEETMNAMVGTTPDEPPQAQATEAQINKLWSIEKSNNRSDKCLDNVSSFIGRKIAGLGELTIDEAAEYINMLEEEKSAAGPDWM